MGNSFDVLGGYKASGGIEVNGGEFGLKFYIKIDRELNRNDQTVLNEAMETIRSGLMKESLRLDPKTHESAATEREAMTLLFPSPIYVEEIPNGYCSRYCCSFKPWFVVTTKVGRIKIGWRKSVIHLEWTDSAIKRTAAEIFPKEEAWPGYETTQYDKVIHAHGYGAAKKYIERLMEEGDAR